MKMRNSSLKQTFETKDLWLTAALIAADLRLSRLDWRSGRAFFIFQDGTACKQASEAYWQYDLMVKAKAFADALRTLKDRLHAGDANGE